jgi:adenosine deaminase
VEWRLSIYGRNINEWDKLAKWVVKHKLFSHNLRWLIQIPRLYEVFKGAKQIDNFQDIIRSEPATFLNGGIVTDFRDPNTSTRCVPTVVRGH